MSDRNVLDLDRLVGFSSEDPRVAALEPHERAQLAAYREFMREPTDLAADRLADADRRLGQTLDEAIGLGPPDHSPRAAARTSFVKRLAGWFAPPLRPVLAAAAVLAVMSGVWFTQTRMGEPVMRGSEGSALVVSARSEPGAIALEWTLAAPGVTYEVHLFGSDLEEVARFDAGSSTRFTITHAELQERAIGSASLSYQVVALRDGDIVARSRTAALTPN